MRVSTRTFSPSSMKSGTWISTPFSSFAGFVPPPEAVLPLTPGLGLGDLQVERARDLDPGRALVDEQDLDLVVGHDPAHLLAGDVARELHLLVVGAVHEHRHLARVVEVLHPLRLGAHRPELLAGAEGLVLDRAVVGAAQLRAHEGAALARLHVLELHDLVDRPVDLDMGPVLELVRGDHPAGEGSDEAPLGRALLRAVDGAVAGAADAARGALGDGLAQRHREAARAPEARRRRAARAGGDRPRRSRRGRWR